MDGEIEAKGNTLRAMNGRRIAFWLSLAVLCFFLRGMAGGVLFFVGCVMFVVFLQLLGHAYAGIDVEHSSMMDTASQDLWGTEIIASMVFSVVCLVHGFFQMT